MIEQEKIRKLLIAEFAERQARNTRYSMHAFARSLAIGAPALSEIVNGKRRISVNIARRILDRMALDPAEKTKALAYFGKMKSGARRLVKKPVIALESDQYHAISEWFHFAILSLSETEKFSPTPEYIAKRLSISEMHANNALKRLERLGFIAKCKNGQPKFIEAELNTSDDIKSMVLQKAHRTNLQLAEKSLEIDSVDARDFSSVTMAIDPAMLPAAKRMIREFTGMLCKCLENNEKKEVYKLCVQLFPLSRPTH